MPRDPDSLALELLGQRPDTVEPLTVWADHATFRVTIQGRHYVVKTDERPGTVAVEAAGYRRAIAAGIRVPELIAVAEDALVVQWIDGVPLHARSTAEAWRDVGAQLRIAHELAAGPPFGAGFGGYEPAQRSWRDFFETFAERELRSCERELGFPADRAEAIRAALRAAAPMLDTPLIGWCHGDLQPDHVLIDPATDRVASIIDWADQGPGDIAWDVMVLTLDHAPHLGALLDGYDASEYERAALAPRLSLFGVVRLFGEAHWLARHGVDFSDSLQRAIDWRA